MLTPRTEGVLKRCTAAVAWQLGSAGGQGLCAKASRSAMRMGWLLVLFLGLTACSVKGVPAAAPAKKAVAVEVDEPAFAGALHRILRQGASTPKRAALLAGVVRRQLAHAAAYFDAGRARRGTQAVVGALYMLRLGEIRPDMFDTNSQRALSGAIRRFSARGDVGRSLALMYMQKALLAPGSIKARQLAEHMAALDRWAADTRTGLDMEVLSSVERAAVGRAMLDPSEGALMAAAAAVSRWIDRAVEYNLVFQQTRRLPPRAEAIEAFRALQSGAHVMAAIFLRYGQAAQALKVIESSSAGRVMRPNFFSRLRAVVDDGTAEDWRTLAGEFSGVLHAPGDDFPEMDTQLVDAAMWGILVEAYRLDPTSLAVAHRLARLAVKFGMSEVAPLILADAVRSNRQAVSLSGALEKVDDILVLESQIGSPKVARRVFAAAKPLLAIAVASQERKTFKPSPADLCTRMAGIELRSGHSDAARALLRQAVQTSPSLARYFLLATLLRDQNGGQSALAVVNKGLDLPAADIETLPVARLLLLRSELLQGRGQLRQAEQSLNRALAIAKSVARTAGSARAKHRAWLLVARMADRRKDGAMASEAFAAARALATTQPDLLDATLLRVVARSVARGDIRAARAALQQGIMSEPSPETMVRCAIWVMLLEQRSGSGSDGKVARVLLDAVNQAGWTGKLARWARGMLTDAELGKNARSYERRVQVAFYLGLRAWGKGQRKAAQRQFERVRLSTLPGLAEIALARDLLLKSKVL